MVNESLISVPPSVKDPVVLQRFLSRLVEQLDIVLGNRAGPGEQYVSQQELIASANALIKELENAQQRLEDLVDTLGNLDEELIINLVQEVNANTTKNTEQDSRLDAIEAAGYITDAPADGNLYGRKDNAWEIIP